MARLNVYVPDELAARAREAGLNVSRLTQVAIEAELQRSAMRSWSERVRANPPLAEIPREEMQRIVDEVRDDLGRRWDEGVGDELGD